MLTKTLIAMVGRAKSGKDTAYELIKELYPEFERIAFADKLKQMTADTLEIPVENLATEKEKYRPYVIFAGNIFRQYNKEFWVDQLLFENEVTYKSLPTHTVVTDVRFENEIRGLKQFCDYKGYNFVLLTIRCTKETLLSRGYNESIYDHYSENLIDRITTDKYRFAQVPNNGSLEQFKNALQTILPVWLITEK